MLQMNLTDLVANLFIRLNKLYEIRKIYFDDIYAFDKILKEDSKIKGYTYIGQINYEYFYELKYNYSMLFEVYEEEMGYVVKLRDNIMNSDLEESFRHKKYLSNKILNQINYEEIFFSIANKIRKI